MTEIHRNAQQITLEYRLQEIISQARKIESDQKALAKALLELQVAYIASGRTGFYDWLEAAGLARATAHRYIRAAQALAAGLDPEGARGWMELVDLGTALQHGVPVEELIKTPAEKVPHVAEKARNQGIVRVPIDADYAEEWQQLVERTRQTLLRENIEYEAAEAAGLLVMRVNVWLGRLSDEEFAAWLELSQEEPDV
jgi:hypothetical protein